MFDPTAAATDRAPHPALVNNGSLTRWLAPTVESRVERIPIGKIQRRPIADTNEGDRASFAALTASIEARGIVEPLLLRPAGEHAFTVVCGARRLRAAERLCLKEVPAIVRDLGDVELLLTGAWQALLRLGISEDRAEALERRLIAGGLLPAEAAALVGAIPRLDRAPQRQASDQQDATAPLRFLTPAAAGTRRMAPIQPTIPPYPAPEGILFPAGRASLAVFAGVPLPKHAYRMAA